MAIFNSYVKLPEGNHDVTMIFASHNSMDGKSYIIIVDFQ